MKPLLLLVDDDEDDIILFKDALDEVNPHFILECAGNGREGIRKLNLMQPQKPLYIFSDVNMPVMSGWDFLKELKQDKNLKDIPVIILTTLSQAEARSKAIHEGAADFFTKPVCGDDLRMIIASVTGILQDH